ncbi:acyltransferase family protein [Flavobacterium aurantiibacter]|uniref:Acyltransferase n=1 Tax=Flavobacterium aurantiibacter TaxID=2023067 RepID=A0A255ZRE1_9FLAO|nr:acyltransferase family protein [Flavobacterium aurantiibacter]OYQ43959.1 hypothetical protein CHX27_08290 [Flavobacterium aurantiibacter]
MSSLRYRPEIDGLRTIAVLPVIFFHLGFSAIAGGFYGVDVFFVISGYLITSLLLKDIQKGSFSFKEFWIRRVKRIMPALLFLVLVVLLVFPLLIFKGDLVYLVKDALSAIFSYANFHAYFSLGDYWGNKAESSSFLHAWSLSLEEQFYIVFPLFLFLLHKYNFSTRKGIAAVILFSLVLYTFGYYFNPDLTFYMLPSRAWELAFGGILATVSIDSEKIRPAISNLLAIAGLLFILSSYFLTTAGGISIVSFFPVLGTVLIILFAKSDHGLGRILSTTPMVYIGKLSYSLYLWHWPIIVLLKSHLKFQIAEETAIISALALTILFSLISYYFIETKTRTSAKGIQFVLVLLIANVSIAAFLNYGVVKEYKSDFDQVVFYGLQYDITPKIAPVSDENKTKRLGVFAPERDNKFKEAYKKGGIIFGDSSSTPKIIVLGDSHGAMWGKTLHDIANELGVSISFYTAVGNPPFFKIGESQQKGNKGFSAEQRSAYANNFLQSLKLWKPDFLVISCRWDSMDDEKWSDFYALLNYTKTIGIKVVILNQPPVIDIIGDRNSAQYLSYLKFKPKSLGPGYLPLLDSEAVLKANATIFRINEKYKNVVVVDIYRTYRKSDSALVSNGRKILYYDDDHLSYDGTQLLKDEILKVLKMQKLQ